MSADYGLEQKGSGKDGAVGLRFWSLKKLESEVWGRHKLHSKGRWGLISFQLAPIRAGHTPTPPPFQDKEKSLSEQKRYSLIDPASAPELLRLQHQLVSTEDALRDALDQAQQVERLVEALRGCSDRTQVSTRVCSLRNPSPKREAAPSWGLQSDRRECPNIGSPA